MEKAYPALGSELSNEITLVEAGCLRFFAPGECIGSEATEARRAEGVSTQLIYAEVDAVDCDVRGGEPVLRGAQVVGMCTSGAYGHATGKSLAFAYVDVGVSDTLEVLLLGEWRSLVPLDGLV